MKKNAVITAVGKDQSGIVAGVSKVLFDAGCNLEDSSMTILEGEFAIILIVSLPEGLSLETLDHRFNEVRDNLHLTVFLKSLTQEEIQKDSHAGKPYMISVYGGDKPGIVYRVTDYLAREKINITDVSTKRISGQEGSVYMMMLEVELPQGVDEVNLKRGLEELGRGISITITLHSIETNTL